ncbi:MAG: AmmeMemoRadiSam system protein B [Bryobacteraceae bacterium]
MSTAFATPFAGTWYPAGAAELEQLLDELFETSEARIGPALPPAAVAAVAPHAGLAYSGHIAAAAWRCLAAARPSRVVMLGFLHSGGPPEPVMPRLAAYDTPLGRVPVDCSGFDFAALPPSHACDHSLEIQLPLAQRLLPGVPVAPLYIGSASERIRSAAARRIVDALRPGDVLLASTDLTHYGRRFGFTPFPLDAETPANLHALDREVIDAASSLDPSFFLSELRRTGSTTCGVAPVSLLLEILGLLGGEEIFQAELDYATTGDQNGDYSLSVGYAALGYFPASSFHLDEAAQRELLASAEATLAQLRERGIERPVESEAPLEALDRRGGVFVSLHQNGELFGCIGRIGKEDSYRAAVPELALSALHDPRFPTRTTAPPDLEIEISILTPFKRLPRPDLLRPGEHGGFLECWGRRGLLLPQVAREHNATREWFLEALSRKAGLPAGAWRNPESKLWAFRAQVFSASSLS